MARCSKGLRFDLNQYPNSFRLKGHEELMYPKLDAILQKLRAEEDDCQNCCSSLRTHYVCSVKNLKAFVLFKFNKTAEAFGLIEDVLLLSQGRNVVCLANRGLMSLDSDDPSDAEDMLVTLKQATRWDLLLANAELAFSYRKMGPRYNTLCRDAYEKVIAEMTDDGQDVCGPNAFRGGKDEEEFCVFWCYGAAVAIDRALDKNVQTNFQCFDVNKHGDPEILLRRGCEMLKYSLERSTDSANVWIKYVEMYKKYKQIEPKRNRTLKLQRLTPGNENVLDCLENAVAEIELSCDHDALMRLGRLFLSGPRANFQLAKHYLYRSLMIRETAFAHHQLSRAFTMEADGSLKVPSNHAIQQQSSERKPAPKRSFNRSNSVKHIENYYKRSPNDFRLKQAIAHIEKANELAAGASSMMLTDLARCMFRCSEDASDTETQSEIFGLLRQALSLKSSTKGDRAKTYMHMGMIKELIGERERAKVYLKKSVEEAAGSRLENFPSLSILLAILREELSFSTDDEDLQLYEMIQKIGKPVYRFTQVHKEKEGSKVSESILNFLEGKMLWFKGRGKIQEALVSLKLLMTMRDLCPQEREFAINLCLEAESGNDANTDDLAVNNFQELFATLVKSTARESLEELCATAEQIVNRMVKNGEKSEEIYAEILSQFSKFPGADQCVVEDMASEAERISAKMEDTVVVDIQHRLLSNLLKSSFSSHHDILIYSCDAKEDKEETEKLVEFLENGLGLEGHCCWAQRDLVHNCGGEYEVYMTMALCRSTRVLVHVTPQLLQDKMDVRILTSVLHDNHERAYGEFIMVETGGDPDFVFPGWCRHEKSSVVSLPSLELEKKGIPAKRKIMRALLSVNQP